jgi:Tfp pilus assembly protein PilF
VNVARADDALREPAPAPARAPIARVNIARADDAPREGAPAPIAPSSDAPRSEAYAPAFIAESSAESSLAPLAPGFFETISSVRALAVRAPATSPARGPLASLRGYKQDDLFAIAEVGYHYLFSGGVKLAFVLFDGLAAIAPGEAYFALALGLTYDRMNDRANALSCYRRASELDPGDGRPDINVAELHLEAGDLDRARRYLARGTAKARARGDDALAVKGCALLEHLAAS